MIDGSGIISSRIAIGSSKSAASTRREGFMARAARSYQLPAATQQLYASVFVKLPFINGDDSWELPVPATFLIGVSGRVDGRAVAAGSPILGNMVGTGMVASALGEGGAMGGFSLGQDDFAIIPYGTFRKQFGTEIFNFPRVGNKLVMMAAEIMAARQNVGLAALAEAARLVREVSDRLDRGWSR